MPGKDNGRDQHGRCLMCGRADRAVTELVERWRARAAAAAELASRLPPGNLSDAEAVRLAALMGAAKDWTEAADELGTIAARAR